LLRASLAFRCDSERPEQAAQLNATSDPVSRRSRKAQRTASDVVGVRFTLHLLY
jgi:hypothetical protein